MRDPLFRASFDPSELICDSFAGGGGASIGIEAALGRPVDIAINHDAAAIAMHKANHPETRHYRANIWEVAPKEACGSRPVGLAWFSPDCAHFSRAKGTAPRDQGIRGLAWVVIRWAREVAPRIICLENVEEFATWGPVGGEGHPIKARAGETFREWLAALADLGYSIEFRSLVAADYGTPTTRRRLFLVARRDGGGIAWPEATHGKGRPNAWRPAAEVIDWSLPCPSIFERKRSLAEATLKRIAAGISRRWGRGEHDLAEPLPTVTASRDFAMVAPLAAAFLANGRGGGHLAEVRAFLLKYYGASGRPQTASLFDPLHTVTSKARFGLVMIHGEPYEIADIGMRMLQPHELFAAQGFPVEYVIAPELNGKPLTKTAQIRLAGNAVCPQQAEAIVRANTPARVDRERVAMSSTSTATRSLVLPVAGPVDGTWLDLRAALREAWGETTRAANWILTELYARDARREPGATKLGKMPRIYLYPEARALFPALASQTLSSLEQECARKYRARRYELLWTRSVSLPTMRYPVGIPLPSQMWRIEREEGGAVIFSCRLGSSEDGRRWRLRLRGGPHFHRHLRTIDRVIAGEVKAGAATLYRVTAHEGDHRGGDAPKSRLLLRIPVQLPLETRREAAGVLVVATGPDALLVARTDDGRTWRENCDQLRRAIVAYEQRRQRIELRRAIVAYEQRRQRIAEDLKAERRRPRRKRQGIVDLLGELARRHAQVIRSGLHEVAAHLVGFAARQQIAELRYDDRDRRWCGQFPWAMLRQRIAEKCEMRGIKMVLAQSVVPAVSSGEMPGELLEALAEEISA